jgi:hypothetical protein
VIAFAQIRPDRLIADIRCSKTKPFVRHGSGLSRRIHPVVRIISNRSARVRSEGDRNSNKINRKCPCLTAHPVDMMERNTTDCDSRDRHRCPPIFQQSERILFPSRAGIRNWSRALRLAEQDLGCGRRREITAQHSSVLDFRDTVSDTVCEPTGDKVSAGSVCGNRRPRKLNALAT